MNKMILTTVLALMPVVCCAGDDPAPVPAHGRPYFLPESRRLQILQQIRQEDWAKGEYERIKSAVLAAYELRDQPAFTRREGWEREAFWAAFLYALEGDQKYADVAAAWLRHSYGRDTRLTKRAIEALNDPEYWTGSERDVDWYRLDIEAYVAYDWIHNGLAEADRAYLHEMLRRQTEYRMACMDSWGSNPNLNFKPIFMVAFASMALQDQHLVDWGWRRTARQGSFLSMMDKMLKDGGAWHEAAIYAIAHSGLYCVNTMAFYRSLLEGRSWFDHKTGSGASARGMTDYYIDTAYPIERTGSGKGRIRVVTYGDGATSPPRFGGGEHDMFIGGEHPNEGRLLDYMQDGLAMAYAASRDDRYAAFLDLYPDYAPNLWDRPPLPENPAFPAAPSRLLPEFGLAMLRSDQSPAYWTNPHAIAAFLMMTKSYGHEQPDKFHLNLFGANRLLYPDYLRMQYENRAVGWTYTSASHNTMLVDELDTAPAEPRIRHDFAPEVKFLAVSASDVFPSVDQTRVLLLTDRYLLDLFQASSKTPRTYDYVQHSMGLPRPVNPSRFEKEGNISRKYWALDDPRRTTADGPWAIEFVVKDKKPAASVVGLGDEWFDHEAKVRLTMAADGPTEVCYGTWGDGNYVERAAKAYAFANAPSPVHRQRAIEDVKNSAERVGMLVARRQGRRDTVFVAVHEPYANDQRPVVSGVTKLAETRHSLLVRVDAEDFTDYIAVAWGGEVGDRQHALRTDDGQSFIFSNYGWLRLPRVGNAIARGGWQAMRLQATADRLLLNGQLCDFTQAHGAMVYGVVPDELPPADGFAPGCPLRLALVPQTPRLSMSGQVAVNLSVTNPLDTSVSGTIEFDDSCGLVIQPKRFEIGPIQPGETTERTIQIQPGDAREGKEIVPFRVAYRTQTSPDLLVTAWEPLPVIVGRYVEPDHSAEFLGQMFRGPELTARLDTSGLITYLADADGAVRLDGKPLYTVEDVQGRVHFGPELPVASSLWFGVKAAAASHHMIDGCRMQLSFREDRIGAISLNQVYSRQPQYLFTIPGDWLSPDGEPTWKRIIAVDRDGNQFDATPDTEAPIAAMELAFPGASRNMAIAFSPPLSVKVEGLRMQFRLLRGGDNQWSIGFCKPGELDAWRSR